MNARTTFRSLLLPPKDWSLRLQTESRIFETGSIAWDKHHKVETMKTALLILVLAIPFCGRGQNLLSGPNDIVFDESHNRYLVSCWAGNKIVAIDIQGNQSLFRDNVTRAHGMQIRDSVLYIASYRNLLVLDLATAGVVKSIPVPNAQYLGHLTLDDFRHVYISDWSAKKIFRVDVFADTASLFLSVTDIPVGIWFDALNSRLILLSFVQNAPIRAISLPGGILSTITTTSITNTDAICRDANGNYYVSSLTGNTVYRFDASWVGTPVIVATGLGGPSGLGYNARDNVLGVTNYDSSTITLVPLGSVAVKSGESGKPMNFLLRQNYPNPFNPTTKIDFQLPVQAFVSLKVYDILGRDVATLLNEQRQAGSHLVSWDASGFAGGVYLCRLCADGYVAARRMTLLR